MDDTTGDGLFQKRQETILSGLIPVITVSIALAVVGMVGNILTLLFYVRKSKRTVPVILIICLAAADLSTSTVSTIFIPEMVMNIQYKEKVLCKLTHFIGMMTATCSCLFLWITSFDRYRKVCTPFKRQMTKSLVKYISIGIVLFSLLLSIRLAFTYDILEVTVAFPNNNSTIITYYCSANDDGLYKPIGLVFYAVDFVLFMVILCTIILTYTRIVYELHKRRKLMEHHANVKLSGEKVPNSNYVEDNCKAPCTDNQRQFDNNSTKFLQSNSLAIPAKDAKISEILMKAKYSRDGKVSVNVKASKISGHSERNLTLMMLSVSVVFLLCFTPYFVLRIVVRLVLKTDKEYDFSPGIQFALMLPFFNSVFNPVIYSFFNPRFRRYVKISFLKCIGKYARQ